MSDDYLGQARRAFKEEAPELLSEVEEALLAMSRDPDGGGFVDTLFRLFHTLKGSSAVVGMDRASELSHTVENVLEGVRGGGAAWSTELIDLLLRAKDELAHMIAEATDEGEPEPDPELLAALERVIQAETATPEGAPGGAGTGNAPGGAGTAAPAGANASASDASGAPGGAGGAGSGEQTPVYRIRFQPGRGICRRGVDPTSLLDELRALGICEVIARWEDVPPLDKIEPELCYTGWDIVLRTDQGRNAIEDVFVFEQDDCELTIEEIELTQWEAARRLGEILVDRGDLPHGELVRALEEKQSMGELLVSHGLVSQADVQSALAEQRTVREAHRKSSAGRGDSTIRVSSEKLDDLINLIGEMVTVQARLTTIAQEEGNHRLTRVGEDVERLVTELRDLAMTVRMVPIGTLFTRLQRSVHDTAQQLGKEVELRVDGGETELDKRVVDQLGDPLLHILRNAIDHGIEEPTERRESGKDLRGTIELTSGHSDGFVTVDITDDGAGLDAEKLIARARDKGIVSAGTELSPQEAYQLIFRPGFSTAQEVTDLSGRGVGMDVVQQTIQGLGGSVMVYSEPGLGTRFSLRVPLTLAIIEGLLLRVGEQYYVAPLAAVDECLELPQEQRQEGKHTMHVRDEMLPYLDLRELFRINGEAPSIQQVVVSRVNEARVGFVVDEVLGQLQTVIKSLGSIQRSTEGISGATILGNGGVALILDMPKLAGTRTGGTRAGGGAGASVRADDGTS